MLDQRIQAARLHRPRARRFISLPTAPPSPPVPLSRSRARYLVHRPWTVEIDSSLDRSHALYHRRRAPVPGLDYRIP